MLKKSNLLTLGLVVLLVILTILFLWKDIFYSDSLASLNHSLQLSYVATDTLFDGPLHINQELKYVTVTPSVALWCIPPGLYALINATYNVLGFKISNVNIIFLVLQILAVVLAFFTFRKILNKLASFVLSLFVLVFIAEIAVLADYIILPLLILVFAILFYYYHETGKKPAAITFIFLGVLVGLITFIKHNTGIMLILGLSSYFFFTALQLNKEAEGKSKISTLLVPLIIVIHLIFGLLVIFQVGEISTTLYYVLPFGLFFLVFAYYMLTKNRNIPLAVKAFFKNFAILAGSFAVVIAAWIIWMGMTVGFSRYVYSLYGMNTGFTGVWDKEIVEFFANTFNYQGFGSLHAIGITLYSFVTACLIFVPFITAIISAVVMSYHLIKNNVEKIKKYLGISVLAIMGIFFLYPIEGFANVGSRLFPFLFILVFFYLQTKFSTRKIQAAIFSLILIISIPMLFNNISDSVFIEKNNYAQVSEKADIKVRSELAGEVNRAVELINTTTQRNKYYVIDSYSMLYIYYYLTDVQQKNYFVEMRPGILDKEVAGEIITVISDYQYLVVSKLQYDMFIEGVSYNPDLDELFNYIKENYEIKNIFIKNLEQDDGQLVDFYIMSRDSTIAR